MKYSIAFVAICVVITAIASASLAQTFRTDSVMKLDGQKSSNPIHTSPTDLAAYTAKMHSPRAVLGIAIAIAVCGAVAIPYFAYKPLQVTGFDHFGVSLGVVLVPAMMTLVGSGIVFSSEYRLNDKHIGGHNGFLPTFIASLSLLLFTLGFGFGTILQHGGPPAEKAKAKNSAAPTTQDVNVIRNQLNVAEKRMAVNAAQGQLDAAERSASDAKVLAARRKVDSGWL